MSAQAAAQNAALFQPLTVGPLKLNHRVVLAPLTRFRAQAKTHVPLLPMVAQYYAQRASTPGTLLITEATVVSKRAGLYATVPGIWSQEQVDAWKTVTDEVHKAGSFIYVQLWALGRVGDPNVLKENGLDVIGAGDIAVQEGYPKPRPLTLDEIQGFLDDYEQAAKNAKAAGFDGVELHAANGYLPNQFLEDVSNNRTDAYGGSVENRSRFALEIIERLVKVYGAERVGIRLSPFSTFQGMRMQDPFPQYTHIVKELANRHPSLGYLHVVESRVSAGEDIPEKELEKLDFLRDIWGHNKVFLRAGGYDKERAIEKAHDEPTTAIVLGRRFISNPDLPRRWREGVEETPYDRSLFYNAGEEKGYTDYEMPTEAKW